MMLRSEQTSITHGVENGRIPIDEKGGKEGKEEELMDLRSKKRDVTTRYSGDNIVLAHNEIQTTEF